MIEAARIQAEESSELLSSFHENKAPEQIKEKDLDYMKHRFKKSDRPSYLVAKIKQITDSDKPAIEKDDIGYYFMQVDCDILFVSVF